MLTVKNVVKDFSDRTRDTVRLWEAKNVQLVNQTYGPTDEFPDVVPYSKTEVHFEMRDGTHCSIDHGIVYVMNDNGKTVEIFRLEGSEVF